MPTRKWGSKQLVNTNTTGYQIDPSIAVLTDGGYVIVWQSGLIRGQRFDSAGTRVGTEFLVGNVPGSSDPSVTALSNGGFVVSYSFPANGNLGDIDVDAVSYNSNGVPVGTPFISHVVNNQQHSELTGNGAGFAVVYTDFNSTAGDIFLKRFTAAGSEQSSVIVNNTVSAGAQKFADVAELTGGNLAVVWSNSNVAIDVRMRVFNSTGGAVTANEVIVGAAGSGIDSGVPQVTALANGGFVVAWQMFANPFPGSGFDARARLYGPTGNPVGADFLLNTTTIGSQFAPKLASLSDGGFVAVWVDYNSGALRGQVFDAFGARKGGEFSTDSVGFLFNFSDDGEHFSVAGLADGRFVVTWHDGSAGSDSGINSQIFDPRDGVVNGSNAGDTLYGHDLVNDEISGYPGADRLDGLGGNDWLDGGFGADTLNGGTGADTMIGGFGDDTYFVDNAADTIVEAAGQGTDNANASVSYTLGVNVSVETLRTTNAAGTTAINLTGNNLANLVIGNAGANVINGGGGADTLQGVAGNDSFYVDSATDIIVETTGTDNVSASVSYTLATGVTVETLQTTNAASTTAISLTGNNLANTVIGNAGANVLVGGGGADTLRGLGGNDSFFVDNAADTIVETTGVDNVNASLSYSLAAGVSVEALRTTNAAGTTAINLTGNALANTVIGNDGINALNGVAGNDTLTSGAGNDVLIGGVGKDVMRGGAGLDRFDFNALNESVRGTNRDQIADFNRAQKDRIDLATIDADTDGTAGNQAFKFIGTAAFGGIDGQLRCAGGIVQGDVNGDRVADFEIKVNLATLAAGDFVL